LPQYSGPGTIAGVTIALSGSAQGDEFFNFFVEDGITVAPFESTWDLIVARSTVILNVPAVVNYPGVSVPPSSDFDTSEVNVFTFSTFSGSTNLTDLADFAVAEATISFLPYLLVQLRKRSMLKAR
jgi:hypothetical protein